MCRERNSTKSLQDPLKPTIALHDTTDEVTRARGHGHPMHYSRVSPVYGDVQEIGHTSMHLDTLEISARTWPSTGHITTVRCKASRVQ
jgi:hypothetical protein